MLIAQMATVVCLMQHSASVAAEQEIDFESQIRPLLLKHCADCHGPDDQQSSLRLDARHAALKGGSSGPAIVPHHSAQSEIVKRITSADANLRMPPGEESLPAADIQLLQDWIDAGADWPETDYDRAAAIDKRLQHWAFQPIRSVQPPATSAEDTATAKNEVDRFVMAKLRKHNLQLSPRADRRTLIRRLSFDLLGLPATPEQIAAFQADDSPDAWSRLIDQMLASPHYGERWAQHWLDIVRYADTHGFEVNTPRENAWPYRDYVIRALNDDKPYDQFIVEQLAGDLFQADAATGFLVASAVLLPGQIGQDEASKRLARQDSLDEIIAATSGAMLGLTISCARCHDHKFDPITAADYYAMQAFFAGVDYGDRPVQDAESENRKRQALEVAARMAQLEQQLESFEPLVFAGRTLIIDEENSDLTTTLKTPNGPGVNPEGKRRGYRDDGGSSTRTGNLSNGRYTWWNNVPGEDVLTYNPAVSGEFDVWLSWGAHGSGVHTRDARYILDSDGDLTTSTDQRQLASVDQYYPANVSEGDSEQKPLWSGLWHAGRFPLNANSKIILRGGDTGTGITADVIVLQEATDGARAEHQGGEQSQPRLREPLQFTRNEERFEPVPAKFVRFFTWQTHNNNQYEPCIDELEVFAATGDHIVTSETGGKGGLDGRVNVALASAGAVVTSSGNYSETGKHQLKHINDGRYGNDYSWIASERVGSWVQIEFAEQFVVDRVVWGRDRLGQFRDRLPVRFTIAVSQDGRTWKTVATHEDRVPLQAPFDRVQSLLRNRMLAGNINPPGRAAGAAEVVDPAEVVSELEQLRKQHDNLLQPRLVFGGVFREPDTTYVLRRGDPEQRVSQIDPAIPAIFTSLPRSPVLGPQTRLRPGDDGRIPGLVAAARNLQLEQNSGAPISGAHYSAEQLGRLALADWIASPENPLTARVMVNRIWQHHFGRGIVDTASDFGLNGVRPTHPELLDWLAIEFIRSGWSIKHMHRILLNSATYQQAHQIRADAAEADADNRLLWRFASRRIEAEVIRDSMLLVTGELNLQMGGPGFNFFKTRGGLNGFPPVEEFTADHMRRMIYAHKVRMEQVPIFGAFDCPDAGQSMPKRSQSTTAIQALNLFNSGFVYDRACQLAERIQTEQPDNVAAQVDRAFQLLLGRNPSDSEREACVALTSQHGLPAVGRVLFNSNEFLFMP